MQKSSIICLSPRAHRSSLFSPENFGVEQDQARKIASHCSVYSVLRAHTCGVVSDSNPVQRWR